MYYFVVDQHNHPVMQGKAQNTVKPGFYPFHNKQDAKEYRDKLNNAKCSISGIIKPFHLTSGE